MPKLKDPPKAAPTRAARDGTYRCPEKGCDWTSTHGPSIVQHEKRHDACRVGHTLELLPDEARCAKCGWPIPSVKGVAVRHEAACDGYPIASTRRAALDRRTARPEETARTKKVLDAILEKPDAAPTPPVSVNAAAPVVVKLDPAALAAGPVTVRNTRAPAPYAHDPAADKQRSAAPAPRPALKRRPSAAAYPDFRSAWGDLKNALRFGAALCVIDGASEAAALRAKTLATVMETIAIVERTRGIAAAPAASVAVPCTGCSRTNTVRRNGTTLACDHCGSAWDETDAPAPAKEGAAA